MKQMKQIRRIFISFCVCGVFFLLFLGGAFSSTAYAAAREGKIEDVPGLRFENVVYGWYKVTVDVVNTTKDNRTFAGTMVFLDRAGRPMARALLLQKQIACFSTERYTAHFVNGSGEAAKHAVRIIWDFGTR